MKNNRRINDIINEIIVNDNNFVKSHNKEYFAEHSKKQKPYITLVTCSDSRVQPEILLSDPINKIFCVENIGNQILSSEGSVDYGVYHLKTPVLLILGHSDCGAISAFMNGYANELVSIKNELDNLKPAIVQKSDYDDFEKELLINIELNIDYQVEVALQKYSQLIEKNKLCVIGAYYDFKNDCSEKCGKVLIVNINGDKNMDSIKHSSFLDGIDPEFINDTVKRI